LNKIKSFGVEEIVSQNQRGNRRSISYAAAVSKALA
jgi:hypothetical protein